MKSLLFIALFFFSYNSFSYTIIAKDGERFKHNTVYINYDMTTCENVNLNLQKIKYQFESSMEKYWHQVDKARLRFESSDEVILDVHQDSGTDKSIVKVKYGTILIACNTHHYQFRNSPGLGMRMKVECNKEDCRGVILLNSNKESMIKDYKDQQFQGYFAHTIGHIIGLGYSRPIRSIMNNYIFRPYPQTLSEDDIAGFEFLYPIN